MNKPYYKPDPVGGAEQYVGAEHTLNEPWEEQAHNVKLVGHSNLMAGVMPSRYRYQMEYVMLLRQELMAIMV